MKVVVWARVSSREQKEGYSLDAQLRANRDKARREGWTVVQEFVIAESAKRGAERAEFNRMLAWVKKHARRAGIEAILSHKLDRVCRNMRDAVRLQELEDECGVRLAFVENQFGPGAAGALSFNVMAAVAQYYSDNLRSEVLKGMDEKVRQGWLPANAPFGYRNVKDAPDEPIQPDPKTAPTVVRIFSLYASGGMTFRTLADTLEHEGHTYSATQPRFTRTTLSYILSNRFYIGEIVWHGSTYQGKHQPIVNRATFEACQQVLKGRNHRTGSPNLPLAGGLFRCAYCGQSLTGERIRRRLADGSVREHVYYRCANNSPGADHPVVRWKAQDLDTAVAKELAALRMPSEEATDWFRSALAEAASDVVECHRRQRRGLLERQAELKGKHGRLLEAYLAGDLDVAVFRTKSTELQGQVKDAEEALGRWGDISGGRGDIASTVFDWSQKAAERWHGSNNGEKREILETLSLNREVSDVSLCVTKRKPFGVLTEGLLSDDGRGEWI